MYRKTQNKRYIAYNGPRMQSVSRVYGGTYMKVFIRRSRAAALSALLIACIAAAVLPGCSHSSSSGSSRTQLACITVGVSAHAARTIAPVFEPDFAVFDGVELTGSRIDAEGTFSHSWESVEAGAADAALIAAGVWNFTIQLKKDSEAIYGGTLDNRTIEAGKTNTLLFAVVPLDSGTGVINAAFSFPATMHKVTASLFAGIDSAEPVHEQTFTKSGGGMETDGKISVVRYQTEQPGGNYLLVFSLYPDEDDAEAVFSYRETVLVVPEYTSMSTASVDTVEYGTIEYHLGSGMWKDEAAVPKTFTVYEAAVLPGADMLVPPQGKLFAGWYTNAAYTGAPHTVIPAGTKARRIEFWANWKNEDGTEDNASITVGIELPRYEDIQAGISYNAADGTLTLPEKHESYRWFIDGKAFAGNTGQTVNIPADTEFGMHEALVIVPGPYGSLLSARKEFCIPAAPEEEP